jgi:prevent-host-death family protein
MNKAWQLQEAKNKLSEVVDKAQSSGPQEITRHGKKTAVVLSFDDYRRMKMRQGSLVEFFRNSPLVGMELKRIRDFPRKVEL